MEQGNNVYLTAANIGVPHGFTTRMGGVSEGYLSSLNLGANRGDNPENVGENYRRLASNMGFDLKKLVLTNQIHTDCVRIVDEKDCLGSLNSRDYPECDGLVTNTPGIALVIFTADCTPILFHDPVTGTVGAAHAGWRGTALGIAARTVETMVSLGCRREDIRAAIGPNIGQCCFETHGEVPEAMTAALGKEAEPYIRPAGKKFFVDLKGINSLWLRRSGIKNVEISTHCTACSHDIFWSHRITKGQRGSQGAVIVCKENNK